MAESHFVVTITQRSHPSALCPKSKKTFRRSLLEDDLIIHHKDERKAFKCRRELIKQAQTKTVKSCFR